MCRILFIWFILIHFHKYIWLCCLLSFHLIHFNSLPQVYLIVFSSVSALLIFFILHRLYRSSSRALQGSLETFISLKQAQRMKIQSIPVKGINVSFQCCQYMQMYLGWYYFSIKSNYVGSIIWNRQREERALGVLSEQCWFDSFLSAVLQLYRNRS